MRLALRQAVLIRPLASKSSSTSSSSDPTSDREQTVYASSARLPNIRFRPLANSTGPGASPDSTPHRRIRSKLFLSIPNGKPRSRTKDERVRTLINGYLPDPENGRYGPS